MNNLKNQTIFGLFMSAKKVLKIWSHVITKVGRLYQIRWTHKNKEFIFRFRHLKI